MAQAAAQENIASIGHNIRKDQIQELVAKYAETHKQSQILNDERTGLRKKAKELDLDSLAFQKEVKLALETATKKKREGFDESSKEIRSAIEGMDAAQLWAHVFEREERKNAEREAKKKAKAEKNPRTGKIAA